MKRFTLWSIVVSLFLCGIAVPAMAESPLERPKAHQALASLSDEAAAKIEPALLKELANEAQASQLPVRDASTTFLVYLAERADLAEAMQAPSIKSRRASIVGALQQTAETSQAPLVSLMEQQIQDQHVQRYTSYWIYNGFAVEGDLAAAIALAQRPEVEAIRANHIRRLPERPAATNPDSFVTDVWGLQKIRADQVWETYGITGQGVVVANMDSGVDWTHPALQHAYRGYNAADPDASVHDHNWFDPTGSYPTAPGPNSAHLGSGSDHGTHTMGTIVGSVADGSQVYGVAPGAQWIAAKIFDNDGYTTDEWLHAGFQWMMAPTDLAGQNPDPSRAPDIVSNSWGNDDGADTTFLRDLEAWQAAGIFSTWAAGNEGPGAGTINAPASFAGALSVGATDSNDDIAYFSSHGPSAWGEIKPEVSAPGVDIASTIAGGGIESHWDGTSMATPHVAGLAALVYEASDHMLNITDTMHVITSTVVDLGTPGDDNTFGYGRIDALSAVQSLVNSGSLTGTITDAQSGAPISGATLLITPQTGQGNVTATSGADGVYTARMPAGIYDVATQAFGYTPYTAPSVVVVEGTTTQLDVALEPLPSGTLTLAVTKAADGSASPALIRVVDTPFEQTTDPDGTLALQLAAGTYDLQVLPVQTGLRGVELVGVTVETGTTTHLTPQMTSAPTILLVDADAWYEDAALPFYTQSLQDLYLGHDALQISDQYADVPSAATLMSYDVVIWANSVGSPGYIDAWGPLADFIESGGSLLLSGQDIGYWDSFDGRAPTEYASLLHAEYLADNAGEGALIAASDGPWQGLDMVINAPDSARNQTSTDDIRALDPLATPIASYASGADAALAINGCSYRAIYTGFGLEGIGPRLTRAQALERALDWLTAPSGAQGILAGVSPEAQVVMRGSIAESELYLYNHDTVARSLAIEIDSAWPAVLLDDSGLPVQVTDTLVPCQELRLNLQITVPAGTIVGSSNEVTINISPVGDPGSAIQLSMTVGASSAWRAANPPLPTELYRAASAVDGCRILVAGGFGPSTRTDALRAMNAGDGIWTDLASIPIATANAGGAMVGSMFYLLGGYDDAAGTAVDTVHVYDSVADSWQLGPTLPAARSGPAVISLHGDLYAFGGNADGESLDTAVVLRAGSATWESITSLPFQADFAGAVALDPYIYVAGGWPQSRQVARYDPAADAWTTCAPMPTGRHSFVFASDGRYLYAAGGGNMWDGLGQAERYDPSTNTWLQLPSQEHCDRVGTVGGIVADRLYVMGGTGSSPTDTIEYLDLYRALAGSSLAVEPTTIQTGDIVTYTLTLQNPSHDAISAAWRLGVPGGTEPVIGSSQGGGSYDATAQRWHWEGTLDADSALSFVMNARVLEGLDINTLIAATAELDGAPCNSAVTLQTSARVLEPSLGSSTKTVDRSEAEAGDMLTYTISVANSTPYNIPGIYVTDVLPLYTSLVPDSLVGAQWDQQQGMIRWQGSLEPGAGSDVFDWLDASGGQVLDLSDDDSEGPLDLGFSFTYYGETYDQIFVNSNGMVLFGEGSSRYSNTEIPSTAAPNGFVAPFWDDLNPGSSGSGAVYFDVQGTAPHRVAIVAWHNVASYSTSDQQTFQVMLFETYNGIKCQYLDVSGQRGTGSSATVGIESPDGTQGVAYLFDGSPSSHQLHDGLAIVLDHGSTQWATEHIISYAVQVNGVVPPSTTVVNRAMIDDGRQIHTRVTTTTVASPQFNSSTLSASATSLTSGQRFEMTAKVINSGDAGSDDVLAKMWLPASVVTLVPGQTLPAGVTVDEEHESIEWRGALAAGQSGPLIRLQYDVNEDVPVNMHFSPSLSIRSRGSWAHLTQLDMEINTVEIWPSRLVCDPTDLSAGQAVNILIDVRNAGNYTATQASASLILPTELDMVDAMLFGATYDDQTREVAWQGTLLPDGLHTIVMQALVAPYVPAGSTIPLSARIEDGFGNYDTREATLNILAGVLQASQMTITPASAEAGQAVTVTMQLINGSDASVDAVLTNLLPAGLVPREDSLVASSGQALIEQGTVHWNGSVAPGVPVMLSYVADIPADLPPQAVRNVATVTDTNNATYHLQATVIVGGYQLYLPLISR